MTSLGKKYVDFWGIFSPLRETAIISPALGGFRMKAARQPPFSTSVSASSGVVGVRDRVGIDRVAGRHPEDVLHQQHVQRGDIQTARDSRAHVGSQPSHGLAVPQP